VIGLSRAQIFIYETKIDSRQMPNFRPSADHSCTGGVRNNPLSIESCREHA